MSDFDDNIEFIEAYFKNQLKDTEKKQFEERCAHDEIFARQVALFITVEEGIRQKVLQEKRQDWPRESGEKKTAEIIYYKNSVFRKWLPYMAAASLLFAVIIYFSFRSDPPHKLADNYVNEHLTVLSQTMNATNDSLQQGIAAYNNKEYDKALRFFQNIYLAHPENGLAKKNMGLVYLITKDYDKALQEFDELANKPDVYRNPGLFLKAVVLLERNHASDKVVAKNLLEQIVNQKAEGNREAQRWLENW